MRLFFSCILFLLFLASSNGQSFMRTSLTVVPPIIQQQPTDLMESRNQWKSGLVVIPLITKTFAVEHEMQAIESWLKIPCKAYSNPQNMRYSWLKFDENKGNWQHLRNEGETRWIGDVNGDPEVGGQLTIRPFDKIRHSGVYVCHVTSNDGDSMWTSTISKVLNLTYVRFDGAGHQAQLQKKLLKNGSYVVLRGLIPNAYPMVNATWGRSNNPEVGRQTKEIPPSRVQLDEYNNLHIPYFDTSLLTYADKPELEYQRYFHLTCMSVKFVVTDLAVYQIFVNDSEAAPSRSQHKCTLQYQTPRLSLTKGQSSRLVCVFSGAPSIQVTYMKQDDHGVFQPLTNVVPDDGDPQLAQVQTGVYGNTYLIGSAQPSDAGTYSCMASFSGGACAGAIHPIEVKVTSEPSFVLEPSPAVYVIEGDTVTLEWRIKGAPASATGVYQNGINPLPSDERVTSISKNLPTKSEYQSIRSITIRNVIKPVDTRTLLVYARNEIYLATSSAAIVVISPILFVRKPVDQLGSQRGSKVKFTCTAYADDLLQLKMSWIRKLNDVDYPVTSTASVSPFDIVENAHSAPKGLQSLSMTLTIDTASVSDLDLVRGIYSCNVSNEATWNATSARLTFYGDDPIAFNPFQMWMFGPILGGFAVLMFLIAIVMYLRHMRGEDYEVELQEKRVGIDPEAEARALNQVLEYKRDLESAGDLSVCDSTDDELSYEDMDL